MKSRDEIVCVESKTWKFFIEQVNHQVSIAFFLIQGESHQKI